MLVLSAALYPYVYLLARAALREQSGGAYEVARALGLGPWAMFWRRGPAAGAPGDCRRRGAGDDGDGGRFRHGARISGCRR